MRISVSFQSLSSMFAKFVTKKEVTFFWNSLSRFFALASRREACLLPQLRKRPISLPQRDAASCRVHYSESPLEELWVCFSGNKPRQFVLEGVLPNSLQFMPRVLFSGLQSIIKERKKKKTRREINTPCLFCESLPNVIQIRPDDWHYCLKSNNCLGLIIIFHVSWCIREASPLWIKGP